MALPALREDLQFQSASAEFDGAPAWMIHDPVRNRFFRIGWLEFELLSRWGLGNPFEILASLHAETPLQASEGDLQSLAVFFRRNQLVLAADPESLDHLRGLSTKAHQTIGSWLLHNYLFFRVPLLRPQRFFSRMRPVLNAIWSVQTLLLSAVCAVIGLILVLHQWDTFAGTFFDHLTPSGFWGFAGALIVAKSMHELGHAALATRFGVRVARMGVAFMVGAPVLYTDVSESWKLTDRRHRLMIASAGVLTEFAIAGFATLGWCFVQDGPFKNACYFLATTSWVITLLVNASPFLRMDGYFVLSDLLDMPNLTGRSSALSRAWLRRTLLGWDEPDEEYFPEPRRTALLLFAQVSSVYRFLIFLGIGFLVYGLFIKVVGLVLVAIDVGYFVVRPIWYELRVWIKERRRTPSHRRRLLLALGLCLMTLLAWPWTWSVRGEAWLHAERQHLLYSPFPARLSALHGPGEVLAGDTLASLDSPDLLSRAQQSDITARALSLQMDRSVGQVDGAYRRTLLSEQLAQQQAEGSAQRAELERLTLTAPFSGTLVDLDPETKPGVWIGNQQLLGILIDPSSWVVDALIEQDLVDRVRPGASVRFYRRNGSSAPLHGEVIEVDSARIQVLPHGMLSTTEGGHISAIEQTKGMPVPRETLYRVRIRVKEPLIDHHSIQLGSAVIEGEPHSLLVQAWTHLMAVLIRESGF
jgi:putative peptide zinc metalloprotease protein